jgi:hypothetical protein
MLDEDYTNALEMAVIGLEMALFLYGYTLNTCTTGFVK